MREAVLAYAEGSPCPTLVVAAEDLLDGGLVERLRPLRVWLRENGHGDVLKIALIGRARAPGFDLEYRFAQCLPHDDGAFEFAGSCGHSILAAAVAAPRLGCGNPVRIHVRNNGDEVDCIPESGGGHTVTLRQRYAPELESLLLYPDPVIEVEGAAVSGVSFGNPYVFVRIADLGWRTPAQLFGAGQALFARLCAIRMACEQRLGWGPGTFPKVAAVLASGSRGLAVRAISVPSWHPTLALTGVMCLTAAAVIPGTVPALLATNPDSPDSLGAGGSGGLRVAGSDGVDTAGSNGLGALVIRTAASTTAAQAKVDGGRLASVTTTGRRVRVLEEVKVPGEVAHV